MSSRKEELMEIDMGKKPGDKEYYLANKVKEEMQKEKVVRNS